MLGSGATCETEGYQRRGDAESGDIEPRACRSAGRVTRYGRVRDTYVGLEETCAGYLAGTHLPSLRDEPGTGTSEFPIPSGADRSGTWRIEMDRFCGKHLPLVGFGV